MSDTSFLHGIPTFVLTTWTIKCVWHRRHPASGKLLFLLLEHVPRGKHTSYGAIWTFLNHSDTCREYKFGQALPDILNERNELTGLSWHYRLTCLLTHLIGFSSWIEWILQSKWHIKAKDLFFFSLPSRSSSQCGKIWQLNKCDPDPAVISNGCRFTCCLGGKDISFL